MSNEQEIQVSAHPFEVSVDPFERRRLALQEIDNAEFGWFHIRACLVSGVGFFTDSYDLFSISLASAMLGYVYFPDNDNTVPKNIDLGLKVSAIVGNLVGQLLFGWLADKLGRKKMYGVELMIIIIGSLGSALAGQSYAISVAATIIFWRTIMGIGIGGDYPVSAIITSEFATKKRRGAMMSAVFAMQGFGYLSAAIVATIALALFKNKIIEDVANIDYCWRILFGVGILPGLVALYFRLTIPETPRYTMDIEHNIEQANKDITSILKTGNSNQHQYEEKVQPNETSKGSWKDFKEYFGKWENGKVLLATSMTWFALDIAFYGINLNNPYILKSISHSDSSDAYDSLIHIAIGNIIINFLGVVPGYWFTVAFVDSWGRKPIQMMGFAVGTILFTVWGFAYYQIQEASTILFITFFTLSQFFMNFGPNTTTFIVPGEVFPTRYRSTGHGISAASGKLGAIVSQIGFSQMKDIGGTNAFLPHLLQIFAVWMLIGLLFTFLLPETKGLSLEEISNEVYENPKDKKLIV